MIVRQCVSMFNVRTREEGIPLFLDTISSQFLFPVDPFPADFLHNTCVCPRQISRIRPSVLICVATTFPNEKIFKLEREECLARSVVISLRQQKVYELFEADNVTMRVSKMSLYNSFNHYYRVNL